MPGTPGRFIYIDRYLVPRIQHTGGMYPDIALATRGTAVKDHLKRRFITVVVGAHLRPAAQMIIDRTQHYVGTIEDPVVEGHF